jgi:hypothetical protein
MKANRLQELNFLVRTNTPIPLTESRLDAAFEDDLYNDFYTVKELIEHGYIEYVGKDKNYQLFLRPLRDFSIYVVDQRGGDVCFLRGGEIVTLALTKAGHTEFEEWIASTRNPLI